MTTDPSAVTDHGGAESATAPQGGTPGLRPRAGVSRWTAFGTGVGVEVRDKDLQVTIVRVRPSEAGVLGAATVTDFRTRPAAEWGTELIAFLRKLSVGHVAATVLLPRRDVIVRAIHMPGVTDKDLESAIRLQIDSLHPFSDEDVTFSFARIRKTPYVLVGIARRTVIDSYSALFAEAGIKVASFTFSGAALYNSLRVITTPPAEFVVSAHPGAAGTEVYGESEGRPLYSALLPAALDRAVSIARAELRLPPEAAAVHVIELLPRPSLFPEDYDPASDRFEVNALTYATALSGACPWLGIEANLLPPELRKGSSRVRLIPTITLAVVLGILVLLLATQQNWADSRYLNLLQMQIRKYEPVAKRAESLDRRIASTRAHSQTLDDFKRRPRLDIDSLAEVTKLIPGPGYVTSFDMDRTTLQVGGEVDQAAALLDKFDASPLFDKSDFTMPISRGAAGDNFRIRTQRTVPLPNAPRPVTAAPAAPSKQPEQPGAAKPQAQQPAVVAPAKPPVQQPAAVPPAKPAQNPFSGGVRK